MKSLALAALQAWKAADDHYQNCDACLDAGTPCLVGGCLLEAARQLRDDCLL